MMVKPSDSLLLQMRKRGIFDTNKFIDILKNKHLKNRKMLLVVDNQGLLRKSTLKLKSNTN